MFPSVNAMDALQEAPLYHLGVNVLLAWFVLWVVLHPSYFPNDSEVASADDVRRLVDEWRPEPLVASLEPHQHPALNPRMVTGKAEKVMEIDQKPCLNFATHDYLNFVGSEEIERKAIESISKYGVGTCGPRGFYGTFDVHLELEQKIAQHMGMEEAVLYSYGFSTAASAIPAYAKRGDLIFADERVNFPIQKGLDASRSYVKFFRHNDVHHLEQLLKEQRALDEQNPSMARSIRRFLVVEGIYANTGQMCPLPALMRLRKEFKLRMLIDESVSFGTLGASGRGVTEHFEVSRDEVDLVMCSMERSLATIGGFCVGSSFVVEHQRLSGLGYCFSASLPPLLTVAAIHALDMMTRDPSMVRDLRRCCERVHDALQTAPGVQRHLATASHVLSPVKHLVLRASSTSCDVDGDDDYAAATRRLRGVADRCVEHGVAVVVPTYLERMEKFRPVPSIRVTVHNQLMDEDIATLQRVLDEACNHVLGERSSSGNILTCVKKTTTTTLNEN